MSHRLLRRKWIAAGAAAVAAAAAGLAYATSSGNAEMIYGCAQNDSGQLRLVASPGACRSTEKAVSWSTEARATHVLTATHYWPEIEVTAVGTTDIGLPTDANPGTSVVSLTLPQGVYSVQTEADVRRPSGSGIFSCWARDPASGWWTALARAAVGNDAGYARWTALTSHGLISVGAAGGTVNLECWNWQATNSDNPIAFFSVITAAPVTSATLYNNDGSTIQLP